MGKYQNYKKSEGKTKSLIKSLKKKCYNKDCGKLLCKDCNLVKSSYLKFGYNVIFNEKWEE